MSLQRGAVSTSTESEEQIIKQDLYLIEQSPSRLFPQEKHPWLFICGTTVSWFLVACYLLVEVHFIRSLEDEKAQVKIHLWLAWMAECCLYFVDFNWALDAATTMLRPWERGRKPHYKLKGDIAPQVDVFVTCCGEPLDIVMNTVRAAATLDYPTESFRVILLDDGHDQKLQQAIDCLNQTGQGLAQIHYRARKVAEGTHSFFKAGNLNYGIEETKRLSNSELFASLDADMIVSRGWLRGLVPHFLVDSDLGMTTSPQNYYNVPSGDPLAQQAEFSIWNTIYEPIHDRVGEAMCMGTGFVVRRVAVEQIGGWPLTDTGEDYMCSTKLMSKGWKISYIPENYQHGIAPESFQCRVKQRLRWVDAAFEVHQSNNWYLTNDFGNGVTLLDKMCSLIFALRDLAAISTLASLVVLPAALTISSFKAPVAIPSRSSNSLLNSIFLLSFGAGKICDWIVYRHIGLSHLSNLQSLEIWAAPYCAMRCISQLLSSILEIKPSFFVTGSFACPINERSQKSRAPLIRRLTSFGIPLYIIYVIVSGMIVTFCIRIFITTSSRNGANPNIASRIVVPAVLPGHIFLLARCCWKMAVPAWYMAFPPTVPEWREFLTPDKNDVLRPRHPFPNYVSPDQEGGLKLTGSTKLWRDAIELAILVSLFCAGDTANGFFRFIQWST